MSILHAAATHCCTAPHRLSRKIIHPQRLKDHFNTYYLTLYPVTGISGIDHQDFQYSNKNIILFIAGLSSHLLTDSLTSSRERIAL